MESIVVESFFVAEMAGEVGINDIIATSILKMNFFAFISSVVVECEQ